MPARGRGLDLRNPMLRARVLCEEPRVVVFPVHGILAFRQDTLSLDNRLLACGFLVQRLPTLRESLCSWTSYMLLMVNSSLY